MLNFEKEFQAYIQLNLHIHACYQMYSDLGHVHYILLKEIHKQQLCIQHKNTS
jgi:hypothetical protein